MINQEREEKLLKIISNIYVEAHLDQIHPNVVSYHGSLSPEETKIVQNALSQINQLFSEGKENPVTDEDFCYGHKDKTGSCITNGKGGCDERNLWKGII